MKRDIFLLRKTLYKRTLKILLYLSNLAGVVKRPNTPGCEPGIRQFESDHSPHSIKNSSLCGDFFFKENMLFDRIIMLIYLDHGRYELANSKVDHTQVHRGK